ncbi:MAG: aminotransferase class I/II-fold pyridoxal phosphate-dependent enzyme [Haliea sp.]|jgi:aspartate aminotransferase|nr:aminotransferase class I/II-fold pyridoxal phosphate-dependent enzyme [Haliea sp.]
MFEALSPLAADPILGLSAAYREDTNPDKIDLGVGVYKDESGTTPIMAAVKKAEQLRLESETTKTYQSPAGDPEFDEAIAGLLLGDAAADYRSATVQAPGGTGGLRVAAGLVQRSNPAATVWLSQPTWANHRPVFAGAGLAVQEYPYYSADAAGVDFDAMTTALRQLSSDDVVVLHGCCHNPTGADLTEAQWQVVAGIAVERGFVPLVDIAYQGFARGLDEDAFSVRCLARQVPELIAVSSCSKNFGLYRERTGAVCLISRDRQREDVALQHLLNVARSTYSMPPAHGAAIVSTILHDQALRQLWEEELTSMRDRMNACRNLLADRLAQQGVGAAFDHIRAQRGMFSYLGVSVEQVARLREEYSIYMVNSGRINIAGVNQQNLEYLADALAAVSR